MKTGLIIAVAVIVLLLGVICMMLRAAVRFTDKHAKTVSALRKARAIATDYRYKNCDLQQKLIDAKAEVDKWKCKAVEISINAQKGTER